LFTEDELNSNSDAIRKLNAEYSAIHHLDGIDISISAVAALTGAAIDLLLVGIPQKGPDGLTAGSLSNYVRAYFEKKFPPEEMEKLANSKESKVSFDAQDNRHTTEYVQGLSAYYHRLLSLGHDPLLGFVVGVFDILTGRMTTIDKAGKIVSQVMENYADRKESDIFAALAKQVIHFKSDITTSMGLPAPLMGLFNLLQFGSIGEEEQTIAEIVQGMYYEGYDFIHFCSLSIPVMITEVIVRLGYALKRIKEGNSIKDSLPLSTNRENHPKLATMLFIAHAWAGVLPAGQEAAEKALEKGCEVYRLYSDNTEGLCVDAKEIADHAAKGGMLGISKESWMAALEKENYLKAAEMSMEDDYGMIDGIINNGPKEDKTAEVKAPERGEKSSIMDRLKSAKAEKQKECCHPKKHKGEIEL
jgi:hypothetical protein